MHSYTLRHIPDDIYEAYRRLAYEQRVSLQSLLLQAIQAGVVGEVARTEDTDGGQTERTET